MSLRTLSLAASLLGLVAAHAPAESLTVGDPAPPITVSEWVKGEKIDRLEPGKTYVVEFWATWCGPCRASIPHLTQLQKKYKDRGVAFLGVSVWEQDQKKVAPFVKEMGDKMDYHVALDDVNHDKKKAEGKMAEAWMTAADAHGIPTAFIILDQKIAWIGHPMRMDQPLAEVVSGKYDLQAAASKYREEKAQERKLMAVYQKFGTLIREKKTKEALAVLDEALADNPKLELKLSLAKLGLLLQEKDSEASAYGDRLVDTVLKDEANALNEIAWAIVNPETNLDSAQRDLKLALKAARRANDLTNGENPMILDTLAKVYFDSGDAPRALELQERAVKIEGREDKRKVSRLEQYRQAVEKEKP